MGANPPMSQFETDRPLGETRRFGVNATLWPALAIALVLALQAFLVLTRAINWDEFWYYTQIEKYARDGFAPPLQALHVHLFGWLTALPGNGVDHIVTGRIAMFAAELATLGSIWAITSHFTDRKTGLLCVLAYLGSIYTMQHGFAFRTDPLAASLAMGALVILLKSRLGWLGIGGFALLLGLAGMVTIKVALFAPAFAGIAWMRLKEADSPRAMFARLAGCAIGALAAFGAFYGMHQLAIETPAVAAQAAAKPGAAAGAAAATVKSAADYSISLGAPYYSKYLKDFTFFSPLQLLLIVVGAFALIDARLPRQRKIALAAMLAASLCFFFYRNTLPYFYPFILAPVICGAAPLLQTVSKRFSVLAATAPLALFSIVHWTIEPQSPIDRQRAIVDAARTIFPEPVHYFDFPGMLGSFEKANPFMTNWGMANYKAAGVPVMRQAMLTLPVPLVLVSEQENYPTFRQLLTTTGPSPYFVDEDAAALRDNYLRFWGPYWLAGKAVPADGAEHSEEFLVPGPYTVRDAPVIVNGTEYAPGAIVRLERGVHVLQAAGPAPARLIWGERLEAPGFAPPERPYWTDF